MLSNIMLMITYLPDANVGIVERFEASFTDLKVGGSNPANDCIRL